MREDLYNEIFNEAMNLYRKWQREQTGVRGQVIRVEDGIDYWVAVAAYNRGCRDSYER